MKNVILLKLMLVILLAACSPPSAAPTETLAPTDTPTATQTQPTPTKVKPTVTPTLPTPTQTPTFTPTVTETLPPPRDPPLAVAYVKDGDVYYWVEGVGSTRLTTTGGAARLTLSDDGNRVAFTRFIDPDNTWDSEEQRNCG
jgi:glucose/arabinose dehydrogenase